MSSSTATRHGGKQKSLGVLRGDEERRGEFKLIGTRVKGMVEQHSISSSV